MSEADLEVVRRAAAAWAEGGGDARLDARFEEDLEDRWMAIEDLFEAGGRVVMVFNWGGRGRGSGIEVEERGEAWVFRFAGGKIVQVDEYANEQEALDAVGGG